MVGRPRHSIKVTRAIPREENDRSMVAAEISLLPQSPRTPTSTQVLFGCAPDLKKQGTWLMIIGQDTYCTARSCRRVVVTTTPFYWLSLTTYQSWTTIGPRSVFTPANHVLLYAFYMSFDMANTLEITPVGAGREKD